MCSSLGRKFSISEFRRTNADIDSDPGIWCIGGSFALNRSGSLNLALQIKATEVGLNPGHYA